MPLGVGSGLWACILPKETTNILSTSPSFEYDAAGWTAYGPAGSGTVGTTSAIQQFGAWSGSFVTQSSSGTAGVTSPAFTTSTGSAYSFSAYIRPPASPVIDMIIAVGDSSGNNILAGSVVVSGGNSGTWQRYVGSFTESAGASRKLVIRKTADASGQPSVFYVDGVQVEMGSVTTYIDGDQPGGTWTGGPHVSTSIRSGQYRGGGSVIALADLGLQPDQYPGAGMAPIEDSAQSYAVTDGAQFQRQRAAQRKFTLTAKPIVGTSLGDFHVTRRTLIDAFKPDLVTPQQPIRFLYVGGQGTSQIDAYYDKGLELGNMDGVIAENAAISFNAYDPYWYAPTQQGTTLAPLVQLGSVNYMARRSALGAWGTMGQNNGTTILNPPAGVLEVDSFVVNPGGTVFLGGNWGTLGGTTAPHIGMYFPTTNTFGTLAGGTVQAAGGPVHALAFNPGGTLFLGGLFLNAAGTTCNGLARWSGAFGTLQGGTLAANAIVWALKYAPTGTLFVGGLISTFAGTTNSANAGMWNGAAFGSLGGTVNSFVYDLAWGLDQRLFLGGAFTTVNGTQGTAIAQWKSGTLGTMYSFNSDVLALGVGPNGVLYEAGLFNIVAGGSALKAASWNGIQHSALGYGIGGGFGAQEVAVNQQTGAALFAGRIQGYGSIDTGGTVQYTLWNGASWLPPDIRINATGYAYTVTYDLTGALYLGGEFTGTAQAASVSTIVNTGRAQAYPQLRIRNLGAGTAHLYQLLNVTTGNGIYFNYTMLPGEQALLNLQPGSRSFQSNAQGNLLGAILPGSNLATWSLLPGTNYVSHFADSSSVEASFFWTPRGWSIDSGTVY